MKNTSRISFGKKNLFIHINETNKQIMKLCLMPMIKSFYRTNKNEKVVIGRK